MTSTAGPEMPTSQELRRPENNNQEIPSLKKTLAELLAILRSLSDPQEQLTIVNIQSVISFLTQNASVLATFINNEYAPNTKDITNKNEIDVLNPKSLPQDQITPFDGIKYKKTLQKIYAILCAYERFVDQSGTPSHGEITYPSKTTAIPLQPTNQSQQDLLKLDAINAKLQDYNRLFNIVNIWWCNEHQTYNIPSADLNSDTVILFTRLMSLWDFFTDLKGDSLVQNNTQLKTSISHVLGSTTVNPWTTKVDELNKQLSKQYELTRTKLPPIWCTPRWRAPLYKPPRGHSGNIFKPPFRITLAALLSFGLAAGSVRGLSYIALKDIPQQTISVELPEAGDKKQYTVDAEITLGQHNHIYITLPSTVAKEYQDYLKLDPAQLALSANHIMSPIQMRQYEEKFDLYIRLRNLHVRIISTALKLLQSQSMKSTYWDDMRRHLGIFQHLVWSNPTLDGSHINNLPNSDHTSFGLYELKVIETITERDTTTLVAVPIESITGVPLIVHK